MIALLQRVSQASVAVAGRRIAAIDTGVLVFVAAEHNDDKLRARRLAERVLNYRLFADAQARMNLSAITARKAVLAVPQFTLAADTRRGNRPGFSHAAQPVLAKPLFDVFVATLRDQHPRVESGHFGADMQVALVNDGPVTFWLEV